MCFFRSLIPSAALALATFFCSCDGSGPAQTQREGRDTAWIAVDENYRPIIREELEIWHDQVRAHWAKPFYVPEADALRLLLSDSVGMVILSRELRGDEKNYFVQKGFTPRSTWLAYDGIALIVHPDNPMDSLDTDLLRELVTGRRTTWPNGSGEVVLVFDNDRSSTLRFVSDSICRGEKLGGKVFATQTNPEVIAYVAKNKNALGVIGVNWVSNLDNPTVKQFREEIKLLKVARPGKRARQPFQYYLRTREYPLSRNMYGINCRSARGAYSNFASFLYSERGQLIIHRAGLVPANSPVRIVNIRQEPVNIQ
jgi:phosphate transport system substrate-binding protein